MATTDLAQLKQEILALFEELSAEQQINARKLEKASAGSYPYGEGMHDGLRYAADALESILRRHGWLEE